MLPQHDDFKRRLADIVKRDSRHIERVAGHFAAELLFLQGKNLVRLRERNRAHLFIVAHDDRFLRGKKNRELRNVSLTRFVNDEAVETLLQVETRECVINRHDPDRNRFLAVRHQSTDRAAGFRGLFALPRSLPKLLIANGHGAERLHFPRILKGLLEIIPGLRFNELSRVFSQVSGALTGFVDQSGNVRRDDLRIDLIQPLPFPARLIVFRRYGAGLRPDLGGPGLGAHGKLLEKTFAIRVDLVLGVLLLFKLQSVSERADIPVPDSGKELLPHCQLLFRFKPFLNIPDTLMHGIEDLLLLHERHCGNNVLQNDLQRFLGFGSRC